MASVPLARARPDVPHDTLLPPPQNFECEPSFRRAGEVLRSGTLGNVTNFSWDTVNRVESEGNQWLNTAWRTVRSARTTTLEVAR